jgi:hypothetical protein
MASKSVTSPKARALADPRPAAAMASRHFSSLPGIAWLATTKCPSAASRLHVAVPMPPTPPVTSATFFIFSILLLSLCAPQKKPQV